MIEFRIEAISCGHCVQAVKQAVREVDPEARVEVDLSTRRVQIETQVAPEPIAAALTEAGYAPDT